LAVRLLANFTICENSDFCIRRSVIFYAWQADEPVLTDDIFRNQQRRFLGRPVIENPGYKMSHAYPDCDQDSDTLLVIDTWKFKNKSDRLAVG